MDNCIKDIVIPTLPSEPCNGKRYNTKCTYNDTAFPLLNIPINQPLNIILDAFVQALNSQQSLIAQQNLVITDLRARVTALGG